MTRRINGPIRVAHRGASGAGLAPENTLAAFRLAAEIDCDACELDVHRTRDGELVVMHDASLDRTTSGSGIIAETDWSEIVALDAGGWYDARFAGEHPPLLREAVELNRTNGCVTIIEVKAMGIGGAVAEEIERMNAATDVTVMSFYAQPLLDLHAALPEVSTGLLMGESKAGPSEWIAAARALHANYLALHHGMLDADRVRLIHARGLAVWTWTPDSEDEIRHMLDAGVDAVITNYPDRLNSDILRCSTPAAS